VNKFKYSMAAKAAAFTLFVILLITAFGGTLCTFYLYSEGCFAGGTFRSSRLINTIAEDYAYDIGNAYDWAVTGNDQENEDMYLQSMRNNYSQEYSNFVFELKEEDGKVLFSNYTEQAGGTYVSAHLYIGQNSYLVDGFVKDQLTAKDEFYINNQIFTALSSQRNAIIAISAVSWLLSVMLALVLMSSFGYKKGKDGIVLSIYDRIPLDLLAAVTLLVSGLLILSSGPFEWYPRYLNDTIGMSVVPVLILSILLILLICASIRTFAVRVKYGKWWQNTVVYKIFELLARLFTNRSIIWKTVILFFAYIFINAVMVVLLFSTGGLFVLVVPAGLLFNTGVLAALCLLVIQMRSLQKAGEKLSDGDYEFQIDTRNLLWDFRTHGENLNHIGQGMTKAVEERMKSERFKTELITNVSHDIKTPLTSIVNYVDLLKKEDIKDEKVLEYIGVLDRQSARLKKLTEDLVDASKAATGAVAMDLVRVDLAELLLQSVGEYTERFAESNIEAVLGNTETEAPVLADGRLLWRVFDNVLSNVCKYSQPSTRVYLAVEKKDGNVTVTIKNISKFPLNITTDELMERFVRGDASRTTEGSGLGLSIAKSLTELQQGSFSLSVDGDLFKVMLRFPAYS